MSTPEPQPIMSRQQFDGILQQIFVAQMGRGLSDDLFDLDVMEKRANEETNTWEPFIPNTFMFAWRTLTMQERAIISSVARGVHWNMNQKIENVREALINLRPIIEDEACMGQYGEELDAVFDAAGIE